METAAELTLTVMSPEVTEIASRAACKPVSVGAPLR
jgi:hypothetical protein